MYLGNFGLEKDLENYGKEEDITQPSQFDNSGKEKGNLVKLELKYRYL